MVQYGAVCCKPERKKRWTYQNKMKIIIYIYTRSCYLVLIPILSFTEPLFPQGEAGCKAKGWGPKGALTSWRKQLSCNTSHPNMMFDGFWIECNLGISRCIQQKSNPNQPRDSPSGRRIDLSCLDATTQYMFSKNGKVEESRRMRIWPTKVRIYHVYTQFFDESFQGVLLYIVTWDGQIQLTKTCGHILKHFKTISLPWQNSTVFPGSMLQEWDVSVWKKRQHKPMMSPHQWHNWHNLNNNYPTSAYINFISLANWNRFPKVFSDLLYSYCH